MNEVTLILSNIEKGDALAAEQLLSLVYEELRKLAVVARQNRDTKATLLAKSPQ